MVVPPKHPKMIIFSRKTHGCWVPPFLGLTPRYICFQKDGDAPCTLKYRWHNLPKFTASMAWWNAQSHVEVGYFTLSTRTCGEAWKDPLGFVELVMLVRIQTWDSSPLSHHLGSMFLFFSKSPEAKTILGGFRGIPKLAQSMGLQDLPTAVIVA